MLTHYKEHTISVISHLIYTMEVFALLKGNRARSGKTDFIENYCNREKRDHYRTLLNSKFSRDMLELITK